MTRSGWSRRAATVTASKSSSAAFRAQRQDRRSCPVVRGRAGTVILGPHSEVPDRGAALAAASSAPGQAAGLGESVAMRACRALYPCPRWGLAGRWLTHAGSAALARGGRSRRRSQGGTPADEPLSACANQRPGSGREAAPRGSGAIGGGTDPERHLRAFSPSTGWPASWATLDASRRSAQAYGIPGESLNARVN
jgi:hypothetical protein